jgi:hypothetical protein
VVDFLRGFDNLWPIGRYGAFKYNNQDHSMLMGLLVAENIMLGSSHDLWDVNSDTESYQEETEAGLHGRARLPAHGTHAAGSFVRRLHHAH